MSKKPFRVLITRNDVPPEAVTALQQYCEVTVHDSPHPIEREALLGAVPGIHGLFCCLTDTIDAEVLDAAGPNLKVVSTMSVGFEHINIEECKKRKIAVTNTPGVSTEAVAEMTVALMLVVGRRVVESAQAIKCGEWVDAWSPLWMCGQGIDGSTVGIVGMGRIGQAVLKRVRGLGAAKVLYQDVAKIKEADKEGARFSDLDSLLKESDFVVATCNLTEQNKNMFNAGAFKKMKDTAILVNTGRGGLVNQDDLYEALVSNQIKGAGLDVTLPEPLPSDDKLLRLPNLVVTPHVASAEISVRRKMAMLVVGNIKAVLSGKAPETPV